MLSDIKQLMSTAVENRSKIYEGLKARLGENEIATNVAKTRMEICEGCKFFSENVKNKTAEEVAPYVNDFRYRMAKLRPDEHCVSCGCNLSTKTMSLSSECPIKKWLAIKLD